MHSLQESTNFECRELLLLVDDLTKDLTVATETIESLMNNIATSQQNQLSDSFNLVSMDKVYINENNRNLMDDLTETEKQKQKQKILEDELQLLKEQISIQNKEQANSILVNDSQLIEIKQLKEQLANVNQQVASLQQCNKQANENIVQIQHAMQERNGEMELNESFNNARYNAFTIERKRMESLFKETELQLKAEKQTNEQLTSRELQMTNRYSELMEQKALQVNNIQNELNEQKQRYVQLQTDYHFIVTQFDAMNKNIVFPTNSQSGFVDNSMDDTMKITFKDNEILREQNKDMKHKMDTFSNTCCQLESNLIDEKKQNEQLNWQMQILSNQYNEIVNELKSVKLKNQTTEKLISTKGIIASALSFQLEMRTTTEKELKKELEQCKQMQHQLMSMNETKNNSINSPSDELELALSHSKSLKQRLFSITKEMKAYRKSTSTAATTYQQQIQSLTELLDKSKEQHHYISSINSKQMEEVASLRAQCSNLRSQLAIANNNVILCGQQMESNNSQSSSSHSMNNMIKQLQNELETTRKSFVDQKSVIHKLQQKLKFTERHLSIYKEESTNNTLSPISVPSSPTYLAKNENRADSHESSFGECIETLNNDGSNEMIAQLKFDIISLQAQLSEYKNQIETSSKQIDSLQEEKNLLYDQLNISHEKSKQLANSNENYKSQKVQLESIVDQLNEKSEKLLLQYNKVKVQMVEESKKIKDQWIKDRNILEAELRKEYKDVSDRLKTDDILNYQSKIENLTQTNEILREEVRKYNLIEKQLQTKLESAEMKLMEFQAKTEDAISVVKEYQLSMQSLIGEKTDSSKFGSKIKEILLSMEKERENHSSAMKQIQLEYNNELNLTKSSANNKEQQMQKQINSMSTELNELQMTLKRQKQISFTYQSNMISANELIESLRAEKDSVSNSYVLLNEKYNEIVTINSNNQNNGYGKINQSQQINNQEEEEEEKVHKLRQHVNQLHTVLQSVKDNEDMNESQPSNTSFNNEDTLKDKGENILLTQDEEDESKDHDGDDKSEEQHKTPTKYSELDRDDIHITDDDNDNSNDFEEEELYLQLAHERLLRILY